MKDLVKIGAAATVACLVAGCGATDDRDPAAAGDAAPPGQATGSYLGKPRPPISVTLAQGTALESGVPGTITLLVRSGVPISGVRMAIEGDAGLAISEVPGTSGTWYPSIGTSSLAAGEALSVPVVVTPTSGGTRHISGLLRFEVNGVEQGAPFSVPVAVGGPVTAAPVASKPERPPVRDASGELIDSMPAETTVR